ncbi:sigma-70 family RNA polymerase sigma factor [Anaerobacillus sp. CMMVII]|uniref:sigma-70 family RNA polymerase sigma factor n=1 Tax=Anaerobacillus sp. CMMVII TaxID=2755588 RepID=UPI0021B81C09|nr:sigma-70 family RNA polymerase sigma factor [Anaerobacillus sp. CMMVII]MCT8137318.1 sigma-70 family RNA polymerase sigma factor [Anaerobacillus sp. CMMVII]
MYAQNHNRNDDDQFRNVDKEEAIEQLMIQYGEEIKRLIFTYTKNWAQADDLTQDVFLTIYLKLDQFTGKSAIRTWIYSIAINKCKDFKRSWHFRNIEIVEKVIAFTRADTATPEINAIQKDDCAFLMEQVMSLPIKYREVILLFYYKDFTIEEIAGLTGLNQGTVKTRLKRAREKLHTIYMGKRGESVE